MAITETFRQDLSRPTHAPERAPKTFPITTALERWTYGERRPITLFQRKPASEPYGDFLNEHAPQTPRARDVIRVGIAKAIAEKDDALTGKRPDDDLSVAARVRAKIARAAMGEDLLANTILRKDLSRRTVLKALGLGAAKVAMGTGLTATSAVHIDTIVGNEYWGGTNPEIGVLPNEEAKKTHPHTFTLAIGGYNVDDPDRIAEAIGDTMFQYGQIAYLKHSNNGLQIEDLKREADRFVEANGVNKLYMYGHSMGGMVAIELAAHLAQKGVSINTIMLDCSPLDFDDIRSTRRDGANTLVSLDELSIHGGPATRFFIEVGTRWIEGRRDIGRMCLDALREVNAQSCSNRLIQSQARYMKQFNLEHFKDAFPSYTRFVRFQPDDVYRDTTIDNGSAQDRLTNLFPRNDAYVYPVTGGGHASPIQIREGYNAALQQMANDLYFFDGNYTYQRRNF